MNRSWKILAIGVLACVLVIALTPYVWMVLTSFKGRLDILSPQPTWLFTPTLANYPAVFIDKDYLPLVLNSLLISLGTTALSILIGAPAAYVFARTDFAGKEDLFFFFLTTRMAPPISIAVPLFLFFTTLGLTDTIYAVVIAHTSFNLSLVVWMMRGFFAEIPKEIDEAAMMDGRSKLGAFVRVIVPLAAPGLAATAVLCFILSWNEFLYAFILVAFEGRPLTVGIPGPDHAARHPVGPGRGGGGRRDPADHRLHLSRPEAPCARPDLRRGEGLSRSKMAVSFKQVTKRFADGTVALDRLDLDFELGEFVVLLGPSGSGKTTACRLLAGLETPSERPHRDRRQGRHRPAAALPRHRHGVPELRALQPQDGVREHRLSAAHPEGAGRRDRPVSQGRGRPAADRRLSAPQAGAAFRRPGAARRGGARAGVGAGDLPDGRTALQPRCAACASTCAPSSTACTASSTRPSSSSPTTRKRR